MHTKRYLLISTAVAAALAGASDARAGQLYVSVLGGANWLHDKSGATTSSSGTFSANADTGFVVGGAIGLHLDNWLKGLRVEFEGSYRRNDVKGAWCNSSTCSTGGIFSGHVSTFALMANVWYDVDFGSRFKPYIGGGAGYARADVKNAFFTTFTSGGPGTGATAATGEHFGMAWQLGVGLNYEIMNGVDIGVGYRYFKGPSADNFFGEGHYQNENQSLLVSLSVDMP